jgi:hypothetical protein
MVETMRDYSSAPERADKFAKYVTLAHEIDAEVYLMARDFGVADAAQRLGLERDTVMGVLANFRDDSLATKHTRWGR